MSIVNDGPEYNQQIDSPNPANKRKTLEALGALTAELQEQEASRMRMEAERARAQAQAARGKFIALSPVHQSRCQNQAAGASAPSGLNSCRR